MFLILIGMMVAFIGLYIYMSKKFDRTNFSEKVRFGDKNSEKVRATKFELEKNHLKVNLLKLFPMLSKEEQIQWLDELKIIHQNPSQQNNKAA